MNQERKEITVNLIDDINAKIVIMRDGQEEPNKSNKVKVKCRIFLPAIDDQLVEEIQFRDEIRIADRGLFSNWGWESGTDDNGNRDRTWRTTSFLFSADKWADAFIAAEVWAENELTKLIDALKERRVALINADE